MSSSVGGKEQKLAKHRVQLAALQRTWLGCSSFDASFHLMLHRVLCNCTHISHSYEIQSDLNTEFVFVGALSHCVRQIQELQLHHWVFSRTETMLFVRTNWFHDAYCLQAFMCHLGTLHIRRLRLSWRLPSMSGKSEPRPQKDRFVRHLWCSQCRQCACFYMDRQENGTEVKLDPLNAPTSLACRFAASQLVLGFSTDRH